MNIRSIKSPIHNSFLLLVFTLVMILTVGCSFEVGVVAPTQSPTSNNIPVVDLEDATTGTVDEENQATVDQPISTPEADCQASPGGGLVYGYGDQYGDSLWQIGFCGERYRLSGRSNVELSPDGDQALFTQDDDIWVIDLVKGSMHNLTKTPDRIEVQPQWWSGRSNMIIFGSWSSTDDLGPTSGYLSVIASDGSNYHILEENLSNAKPSTQPSGSLIAYDLGGSAWLYDLDKDEKEQFDVSEYGLNVQTGMNIGSPVWSPNGNQLAWWVGGVIFPPVDGSVTLAVFDLEERSMQLLHSYTPIGMGGWLPTPILSPDGNWLAAVTLSEAHKADLWVFATDGSEQHSLGYASNPVWNPDSQSLVYTDVQEGVVNHIKVRVWDPVAFDLPPGSVPRDWQGIIRDVSIDPDPVFGPEILFSPNDEMSQAQFVFPSSTPEVFAIWSYRNMREGLMIRREWYQDGALWLLREEPWDFAKYGSSGMLNDISIYDFIDGLESGRYQLRLFIDGQEQSLGNTEEFSSAYFEISPSTDVPAQLSPDSSMLASVEAPGTLIIEEVASGNRQSVLTVAEISSLAWYPDNQHIVYSIRDRSDQATTFGPPGFTDQLWIVNTDTGEAYPFADQFGQATGQGLHHPSISPDGRYIAVVDGNGWTDACYVARKLWIKRVEIVDNRIRENFSYYQYSFEELSRSDTSEMHVVRIIGWESPTSLKVELGWTCTQENPDGIYLLDMTTLTVERVDD